MKFDYSATHEMNFKNSSEQLNVCRTFHLRRREIDIMFNVK